MQRHIVYICNNNGSDTRVRKELETLSSISSLHFIGFVKDEYHPYNPRHLSSYDLIKGKIRSLTSIFSLYKKVRRVLSEHPRATVHIVNEQLAILLMPLLFRRHVVVDSFDSMFLRMNMPKNRGLPLKRIAYGPPKAIVITDGNRLSLLPDFAKDKALVIPNAPRLQDYPDKSIDSEHLTLCYFGSLAELRGSRFVRELLDVSSNVRCIAAGWILDDYTRNLVTHERVRFLGSLPQDQVNRILAEKGDYLVAVYPLSNINNINASPNKIYDSIHTKTPLLITKGVAIAEDVVASNIGLAVDTERRLDFRELYSELLARRGHFSFSDKAIAENSWEAHENTLCAAHESAPIIQD